MRHRIVLLLPFLALVLMGGECEFKAGVNTLPPEKREGERGRDESGLLVAVNTGGTSSESGDASAASQAATVQSALAASVLELPELELEPRVAALPVEIALAPAVVSIEVPNVIVGPAVAHPIESISGPVPEPGGLVLFAFGLASIGWLLRER